MKRKIYNRLLNWKETQNGKTAILIDGARRVGKSYIVEEFARKEYKSFVLIDFSKEDKQLKQLFEDHLSDLDVFFRMLSLLKDVKLYPRESVVVFDEVQQYPLERQPSRCERRDGGIWHSEQKEKWFGEKFGKTRGKYGERFGEKGRRFGEKGCKKFGEKDERYGEKHKEFGENPQPHFEEPIHHNGGSC